jgi:hypothetical protein
MKNMERITLTVIVNNEPTLSAMQMSIASMKTMVSDVQALGFEEITDGVFDNSMVLAGLNDKKDEVFLLFRWEIRKAMPETRKPKKPKLP